MKTHYILSACMLIVYLTACEKVVTIDLISSAPNVVVEGNITDQPGPYLIKLHKTVNYYDANTFPPVTGAEVQVSDNAGNSEILSELEPGIYKTSNLHGVNGRTYTLKIKADGKDYTAVSTMPAHVPIDSVNFTANKNGHYRVICKFTDPAGILNYYKLQLNTNNNSNFDSTDVRILADGFADGQELTITYRTQLLAGDTVLVKLECIDDVTYNFFRTEPDLEGGIRAFTSAPPANPVNNISNGGLGYFAAYAITQDTAIVH